MCGDAGINAEWHAVGAGCVFWRGGKVAERCVCVCYVAICVCVYLFVSDGGEVICCVCMLLCCGVFRVEWMRDDRE